MQYCGLLRGLEETLTRGTVGSSDLLSATESAREEMSISNLLLRDLKPSVRIRAPSCLFCRWKER